MRIEREIRELNYNPDLRRMLRAIDGMVTELSRLEVEARRTRDDRRAREQLQRVNDAIRDLDGWIVLAALHQ